MSMVLKMKEEGRKKRSAACLLSAHHFARHISALGHDRIQAFQFRVQWLL